MDISLRSLKLVLSFLDVKALLRSSVANQELQQSTKNSAELWEALCESYRKEKWTTKRGKVVEWPTRDGKSARESWRCFFLRCFWDTVFVEPWDLQRYSHEIPGNHHFGEWTCDICFHVFFSQKLRNTLRRCILNLSSSTNVMHLNVHNVKSGPAKRRRPWSVKYAWKYGVIPVQTGDLTKRKFLVTSALIFQHLIVTNASLRARLNVVNVVIVIVGIVVVADMLSIVQNVMQPCAMVVNRITNVISDTSSNHILIISHTLKRSFFLHPCFDSPLRGVKRRVGRFQRVLKHWISARKSLRKSL